MTRNRTRTLWAPSVVFFAFFVLGALGVSSAVAQDRDSEDRPHLGRDAAELPDSLREWIEDLPPEQRAPAARRIRHMPEQRREAFIRRWSRMSESERAEFAARMGQRGQRRMHGRGGELSRKDHRAVREHYRRMTPAERRRFRGHMDRWRDMPPRERAGMRHRLDRFRRLAPAEQEAMVERSFPDATPEERAKKLDQLRAAARGQPTRSPAQPPPPPPGR